MRKELHSPIFLGLPFPGLNASLLDPGLPFESGIGKVVPIILSFGLDGETAPPNG